MKSDARVKYTKMVLKNSLLELLKTKPITKVTVKELCDLAEINRATFYKHYQDVFDLLAQVEDELLQDISAALKPFDLNDLSWLLKEIFATIKRNVKWCRVLFSEYGNKEFLRRAIGAGYDGSIASWRRLCPKASDAQLELFYTFVANGCLAVIDHWVANDMKEDPRQLTSFIESIIVGGLRTLK